jgi:hypothetical protein
MSARTFGETKVFFSGIRLYYANDRLLTITVSSNYGRTFTYDADGNTVTLSGTGGASSASYT